MNKNSIVISKECFADANNVEICMEWAKDFLNSDRTVDFEIDDVEGTIKHEELIVLGCDTKWEAKMHENNLKDYWAYLAWLKMIRGKNMKTIWFRVGMDCEITNEEMDKLLVYNGQKQGDFDSTEAHYLMEDIIKRAELSGETYIVGKYNGGVEDYDNPDKEISFLY